MKYFTWDKFKDDIIAVTTTREVGNIAFQLTDANHEEVAENRRGLCQDLGIDTAHLIMTHQSHSDVSKEVTIKDLGKGENAFEGVDADALYTTERGIALGCFHADCVPLFVYIPKIPLVGIIHAGYPGTLKHITRKTIETLKEKYHVAGSDIFVHIGPARQYLSFVVDEVDKQKIFDAKCENSYRYNGEKGFFDAPFSNINDLIDAGVPYTNIDSCEIDTCDDPNCYSAWKKEKSHGRMGSIILLK
ncbi:MAG: polyphenol oxidase family protein [Coprobacillus sp.]|nr:polyphenol oxidase family protein [Coprobacillus sp.]